MFICLSFHPGAFWLMKGHAVGSWEICSHENLKSTPANKALNTLNLRLKKAQCQRLAVIRANCPHIFLLSRVHSSLSQQKSMSSLVSPFARTSIMQPKSWGKIPFFSPWFHFKVSLQKVLSPNVSHFVWIFFFLPPSQLPWLQRSNKVGHQEWPFAPSLFVLPTQKLL